MRRPSRPHRRCNGCCGHRHRHCEAAEFHFYGALSHAACCDSAAADQRQRHVEALAAHHRQLEVWAENCPENFENRAALVGAEIARLEGRELDAMRLYERAIRSARANGFVHHEALAHELAGRFYLQRGFETAGSAHLGHARACYALWGADGKVRQLDELYPHLRQAEPAPDARGTIGAPVEHLELATVLNVSQAVSGELVLDKLVETLLRTAIEHAGAERGVLIVPRGEELWIRGGREHQRQRHPDRAPRRAVSAARHCRSPSFGTRRVCTKPSILDDASAQGGFSNDEYIRREHAKSVLCLPLLQQGRLMAVLYLENNLAAGVFTPARMAVLNVLASQAAMSLEKARLYHELQQREAKIRRLVDANIIGIVICDLDGRIIEANDAFLRMVGYDRDDLVVGPTPLDGPDASRNGASATSECVWPQLERYRSDSTVREGVLPQGRQPRAGARRRRDVRGRQNEGVAFVLDLTERKRAEEALHQAQAELAHVTRVATLGELTASIAHEINQPLGAVVNNASACVRWLAAQNLEEARQSAARVVADGHRAGEIIGRIRALAKKAPPQKDWLDLNATIRDVIALARSEVQRHGVALQTHLAGDVPRVLGDRVQLQQVLLNLLMNAIEAMSGVGAGPRELWVSSEPVAATEVVIAVRDSGPGLDPQSLDRLFDAFYTTKPHGLGMGLAISRSIIAAHGGRLWATANTPHGAVLQFTVPIGREGVA